MILMVVVFIMTLFYKIDKDLPEAKKSLGITA